MADFVGQLDATSPLDGGAAVKSVVKSKPLGRFQRPIEG